MAVGADPDSHGGKLVNGVLARELGVTTAGLLASALNMEWAVTMFAKVIILDLLYPQIVNSVLGIYNTYIE